MIHPLIKISTAMILVTPLVTKAVTDLQEVEGKASFVTLGAINNYESKINAHPFLNSSIPRPQQYSGEFFELNHDYPAQLEQPAKPYPWTEVTHSGKITTNNAMDYVLALKEYVSKDMRALINNPDKPNLDNWFQSIWLGTEREPIHGIYVGSGFPAGTLTDQSVDITTYVYTLYDNRAAKTLGDIWGRTLDSALKPTISDQTTQYSEGSVIVKFAFVTACGTDWSPMTGTAIWQIYAPINTSNGTAKSTQSKCDATEGEGSNTNPVLTNVYLMQFDIIVKDTKAAPETGWVFSTLVYDQSAPGKDVWDKMIPLGATWGGDTDIVNVKDEALIPPVTVNTSLKQNWINLKAPEYSRSTLAWDGRLSGPNDGAVVTPAWTADKYYHQGLASAGCLGCHSSAQYPMTSFLLPTTTYPPQTKQAPLSSDSSTNSLVLTMPGSKEWMRWFQSNNGLTPMGPNDSKGIKPVALDYDMVTAFKAIPMWQAALAAQK
ncbi:hypothetical protein [Photobacterium satsumensis]|uniref:hypothetical protein n=1 Tax=Photobacterium satsumensis TaxID=2910239 RepID=UPI003D11BC3E